MTGIQVPGEAVAAASIDGVGVIVGTEFVSANERLAEVHGYDAAGDLVGREWSECYAPDDCTAGDLLARVREEGQWRGTGTGHGRNGERFPVELSMRTSGEGIVCVVRKRAREDDAGANGLGDDRYRTLIETAPVPMGVVTADREIGYCNRAAVDLLGGDAREDVVGRSPEEFVDEAARGAVARRLDRVFEERRSTDPSEYRLVGLDGEERFAEIATAPVSYGEEPAALVVINDVTEHRRREGELERYETIVETVEDGVYALDEEIRYDFVNDALCEMADLSREELLGTRATDFLADYEQHRIADEIRAQVVEGDMNTGSIEATAEWGDGETFEVEARFRLYPEPDGEFRGSVGVIRDITERKERERRLEQQRDELDTLNRINTLLLEIMRELFGSQSLETIKRTVCERLVDSELYRFAWISEPEAGESRLVFETGAGIDGDSESIAVPIDGSATDRGPVERAFRTRELQACHDIGTGSIPDPLRETALERDVQAVAAVPLVHDETVYGVLSVYTLRPPGFSRREREGLAVLGEAVGFGINSVRTHRLLYTDSISEIEFDLSEAESFFAEAAADLGCGITLDGYVATTDGEWLLYLTVDCEAASRFVDAAREDDTVSTVTTVDDGDGKRRVGLTVSSSLLDTIAAVGGKVTTASVEPGRGRLTVEVPRSADVRSLVDQIRAVDPGATLLGRTDHERPVTESTWPADDRGPEITDRQRQALEAAYHAGYFEWHRESTAEEVADLLGITPPTLHAHLRKAEREVLSVFFGTETRGEARPGTETGE